MSTSNIPVFATMYVLTVRPENVFEPPPAHAFSINESSAVDAMSTKLQPGFHLWIRSARQHLRFSLSSCAEDGFRSLLGRGTVVTVAGSSTLHAARRGVPWIGIHLAVDLVQSSRKIYSSNAAKTKFPSEISQHNSSSRVLVDFFYYAFASSSNILVHSFP
jgi:hypothetical protein